MRMQVSCLIAAAVCLGAASLASADDMAYVKDEPSTRFEVMPFAGFQGGGRFDVRNSDQNINVDSDSMFGLALDWKITPVDAYELLYSRQSTNLESSSPYGPVDLKVEYLHIGGTVITDQDRRVQPYIAGGLGLTRFSPGTPNAHDEEHFSLNVGGGLKIPFTERFSVRVEARGFVSFVDTNTAIFCASGANGGVCDIRGRGNAFFQYTGLVGAAFAF